MIEKQNKQAAAFAKKVTAKYLKAIKCDSERDREVYCKSSTDYFNASEEELMTLLFNGDDNACAHYVLCRLRNNSITDNDLKYLDNALDNINCDCALIGCFLYGDKKSPYYDEKKAYYCYAITEQYGFAKAHRILKNYGKRAKLIDETDDLVLFNKLKMWISQLKNKYCAFSVDVVPAGYFDVIDYKNAYFVTARLEQPNGYQTDKETVYCAFVRGRDNGAYFDRLTDNLIEAFDIIAKRNNIPQGEIYIKGELKYNYGNAKPMVKAKSDAVEILSDAEIKIKISDGERLESNICPACGGTLGEDGACPSCGNIRGKTDGIEIRRANELEALICTQCGSPIVLDDNGKTAYCPACGTTFIVKGNALDCAVGGINYENIRADMPQGFELPDVKFVRARIADGKITAVMPESFEVMSDELRRIKYPVNAPRYIYTTPDATVNLNVNFGGSLDSKDVAAFGKQMLAVLKNSLPSAKFGEAKIIASSGNIFFVDFISAAIDQPVYNTMFFFSLDGKQGIGSWNCLGKDRWYWAPIFEHAITTMEFNEKKDI